MDWMREIEFEDLLTHDSKLIAEHCGTDILFVLWERLPSLTLYLSRRPIEEAQRRYILKFCNRDNVKDIALRIGVSDSFVYQVLREARREQQDDGKKQKLFP